MTEIFVVVDEHGEYSDHSHANVCAFVEPAEAEAFVEEMNAEIRARQDFNNKAQELWLSYERGEHGDPRPVFVNYAQSHVSDDSWFRRAISWVNARMAEIDPKHAALPRTSATTLDTDHCYAVERLAIGRPQKSWAAVGQQKGSDSE